MMALMRPDRYLVSLLKLDYDEVRAQGFTTLLVDLDNTVLPRGTSHVPERIAAHVEEGLNKGMRICLLSNSWHDRCGRVAHELGVPFVRRALKPLPFGFMRALELMGATRRETLVVGDQIHTDVLGAHLMRMKVVLVKPLSRRDLFVTRFLHQFDRFHLRGMTPES
jgi:HAD superfamily phosphatase (TIGR01668 family)